MTKRTRLLILVVLALVGVVAGYLLMGRIVPLIVDGKESAVFTHALKVRGALRSAGFKLQAADRVNPPAGQWLSKTTVIELNRSRQVRVLQDPSGEVLTVTTAARTVEEILREVGLTPGPVDYILLNGRQLTLIDEINQPGSFTLQYHPAVTFLVTTEEGTMEIQSSASTLGQALWDAGIQLRGGDLVSVSLTERPKGSEEVVITTARPIEISVDGTTFTTFAAAETVGEALAAAGVSMQNLDYSQPNERQALPEDRRIRVVRVSEEVIFEQSSIPYEVELLADDTIEINQNKVIQEGQSGTKASRMRIRYEDGVEVSRVNQGEIILAEPVTRIVHYGSKIVLKTMDTPDGPITYYMAVNVTATSYSPCRSGVPDRCYTGTSYGLPVQKGVIGVHRSWYYMFRGTQIYVPGYGVGTIADIGYYPYNDYWVDLAYTDADYVEWPAVHVTIYFLAPPPAGFTGVMP